MVRALFLALMMVGCAKPAPNYSHNIVAGISDRDVTPVWIDKGFSLNQKAQIVAAMVEWNYALNGYNRFQLISDQFDVTDPAKTKESLDIFREIRATHQGLVILCRMSTDPVSEDLEPGTIAWVVQGEPFLNIFADAVGDRNLKALTLHELGHTMGIHEHATIRGSLMYPSYTYMSTCIDRATIQSLSAVRPKWDYHHMNYCNKTEASTK